MNERIKQLIEESSVDHPYLDWYPDGGYETKIKTDVDQEKFAELIIKECLRISTDVENEAKENKEYKAASSATLIRLLIKDYFGIK